MKLPVRIILAIVSASLLTFSFVPLGHHLVVWVALVPLLLGIEGASHRVAFRLGFLCGMLFYGASLYWFWRIFGPMAGALWAVLAFYIGAFCGLYVWLGRGAPLSFKPPVAVALWVALEYFRSECYYLKFTWFGLGYSQVTNRDVLQVAAVAGSYGISALIVAVNVLIADALWRRRLDERLGKTLVCLVAVPIAISTVSGCDPIAEKAPESFIATALQTDTVGLDTYVRLTEQVARQDTALVVWPEFAMPGGLRPEDKETQGILELSRRLDAVLVVGGKGRHEDPRKWYSSAFVISPDQGIIGEYRKNVPVQFHADGESGGEFPVFDTKIGKLGVAICYDATYPYVVRRIVASGAEVIAVPSYDLEFWGPIQRQQHSSIIPMRAVENRRSIIRSTSFGETHIIDRRGKVYRKALWDEPDAIVDSVVRVRPRSIYTACGWLFPHFCVVLLTIAAAIKVESWREAVRRG